MKFGSISFKWHIQLSTIQFELVHDRVMANKLLHEINLVPAPLCLHCIEIETIVHAFLGCSHVAIWLIADELILIDQFCLRCS